MKKMFMMMLLSIVSWTGAVTAAEATAPLKSSHFFKRKLKNLRRWDARCFFEPPGQVRWLNICP